MSKTIDYNSRTILEYVPDIGYVEPEVVSEEPEDLHLIHDDPGRGLAEAKAVQKLAQNVEKIAEATQKEADELAAGFEIELNPKTDFAAIAALRRHYPGSNPYKITYEQYVQCKDHLREVANGVSEKIGLSEETIEEELSAFKNNDISTMMNTLQPSGIRPEDDAMSSIVDPIDLEEFQDLILRYLVNALWQKFILPVLKVMMPLGSGNLLPKEIASIPKGAPSTEEMMGAKG